MENLKSHSFVRAFTLAFLVVCGLEAFASGGVDGKPNIIHGGYVYYFPTKDGNAPNGEGNIFGHIQTQIESFKPKAGDTNTIVLARGDTFVVPEGWRFCGFKGYDDADPGIGKLGPNGGLYYTNRNDVAILGVCNDVPVGCVGQGRPQTKDPDWNDKTTIADGKPANTCETCYFERNDGARSKVHVHFVKRNDAYYRIANRGIYYVVRGAKLDFYYADDFVRRRWIDEAGNPIADDSNYTGTNWSFAHKAEPDGAGYETFTINAAPGDDNQANEFHIKAEDDERDLTIRVVDPTTFKFDSYLVFFDGPETRKLSSLLYECLSGYELKDVAKVEAIDPAQVSVTPVDGDYELTAHGWYDVDRLVLVTMENGNVVLLKITTMTGRCDETLCASQPPNIVASKAFTCLICDDAGKLLRNDSWELTTKTNNTPHGYAYTWRVPNCVLYDGNRYSVYIACKDADVTDPEIAPAGQLKCIRALRKVIVWLEDQDGNLFASPAVCVGNVSYSVLHDWRFCLGTANCLYTNDGTEENIKLRHHPYLGTALSTYTHDVSAMDADRLLFQGATPDRYGYYAVYACSEVQNTPPSEGNRDELTVFLVAGVKPVTVRKEVRGASDGIQDDVNEKFQFEAVYTDNNNHIVTNRFALANGQEFSFLVATGGVVTVTETERGPNLYATSVRDGASESRAFTEGYMIGATNVWENHVFEFRNTKTSVTMPKQLWITDHFDAGSGAVHLAFDPIFAQDNVDLRSWIKAASSRKMVSVVSATNEADLAKAPKIHVPMRDNDGAQDVDKHWVWITADISDVTNTSSCSLWKIALENPSIAYYSYEDDILSASAPTGSVRQIALGPSTTGYVLTNANEISEFKFKRASRVKEVLLVGGGGAGGGTVGGGGGGGEVRLYECEAFADTTAANDTLWVEVGKGGSPAIEEGGVYYKGTNSVNNAPGNNGHDTTFEWGEVRLTARGGGGGGSYNSTFPGKASQEELGLGRDGANGGGSTRYAKTTGGNPLAEVPDGHAGGKGYANSGGNVVAAGGGGGMKEAGVNATEGRSGNGGEGVEISIAGINAVFGSGGGGGGRYQTARGIGGTNAGDGGDYDGPGGHTGLGYGGDAVPGFGGGGGGGAYMDDGLGYRGGRGGDGKVIFVLQDASVVDATCKAEDVTAASATLKATVVGIGKDKDGQPLVESPVPVWVRCRRDGGAWSEPISVGAAEIGETVSFGLDSLYCSANYDFEFLFGSSDPSTAGLVAAGSFKTADPGFPVGYQDDNFIVSANAGSNFLSQNGDACTLSFTNGVTDAHVIVKKQSTFVRGLVVGGGGAGGGICGGGGGGGAVKRLNETVALAAGTEFVLSVGAGGRALNNTYKTQNESGGDSSVDFAGRTLTVLGGGAGGMPTGDNSTGAKYWNGSAGGNGGGAAGSVSQSDGKVGTGGAGSEGYAGGDACQRADKWPSVAGGGGGAAEPGENANTRRPVGKNGSADAGGHAGNGGEGVADDITGRVVVYGSGGGGGMDQYGSADEKNDYTTGRALGGTGAGDGGLYQGYIDSADTTTPRLECNGRAGQDGTGGGGGGAGYKKDAAVPTGFSFGGDGGDGAVVFQLRLEGKTLPIEAMTETVALAPFGARVAGTVLALGEDVGPVDVWFSLTNGEYRLVKSGVTAGQSVTNDFVGLVTNTIHTYSVLFSNENASVTHDGQFKTWRSNPDDYAYEDENFAINGTSESDFTLTMLADGQIALTVLTSSKELQIRPKNGDLSLARALVVGGGGCGGSLVGAGGGGGEVVRVDEQLSDIFIEPIRVTVGAGGTENTGSDYKAVNNNGGDSTLQLGTRTWTAVGGGAGATRKTLNGENYVDGCSGGSGGGGMGDSADSASNGRGKAGLSTATAGFGYPGGNGANRKCDKATDNVPNVGGGGGGAAEPGMSGYGGIHGEALAQAGHGGEGLADDIAGSLAVYGSGGGGGGDNSVNGGKGGTNGGDGGPKVGDDAKPGVDGFGGGGGGRGYKDATKTSGRGGRGAVILRFRTKGQPINAVARQVGRTLDTSATVEGKVLALGEGVDGVTVSFSRDGESWEPLQTNVSVGQPVQKTLDGLECNTIYKFYFKFETADGETVVVPGQFKTAREACRRR